MPNEEQIADWDGRTGEQWVADAARYDRMSQRFLERIVTELDPTPGEHVLDVGCGNGALSLAVAERVAPDGTLTGLDISTPMLGLAERRAQEAGLSNATFVHGDAQVHPLDDDTYDAVISRFGVMFFDDPVTAFSNLVGSLRPGGRVVFTCWRELLENAWLMVPAGAALAYVPMPDLGPPGGPGPFGFADPERVRSVLTAAGCSSVELTEIDEPMRVGTSVDDALDFYQRTDLAHTLFQGVDDATAQQAWAAVRAAMEPHEQGGWLALQGSAWLVSARR